MPTTTTWMSRREAALYLGVSPQTIDRHARSGRLPKFKVGSLPRFKQSDLDRLAEGKFAHPAGNPSVA